MLNLFEENSTISDFNWIVATFQGCGASDTIKRANEIPLKTYYPLRMNIYGNLVPLWRNYLFLEFRECVTISICRSTFKFINIISTHDSEGTLKPVFVPKNAIYENLNLVQSGIFDNKIYSRPFYGKGSLVKVIDGVFSKMTVRLEEDVDQDMPGNRAILVNLGGWNGKIEIFRLAL
jgi:hypothetical protein